MSVNPSQYVVIRSDRLIRLEKILSMHNSVDPFLVLVDEGACTATTAALSPKFGNAAQGITFRDSNSAGTALSSHKRSTSEGITGSCIQRGYVRSTL